MDLKLVHVSTFGIPYVIVWLITLYKINAVLDYAPYDNISVFITSLCFLTPITSIYKRRHIIDEMFTYFNLVIGACVFTYSCYLSCVNIKNNTICVIVLLSHVAFLYTLVYHTKRYIDPYLTINDYLEVDIKDEHGDNVFAEEPAATNSDVLI